MRPDQIARLNELSERLADRFLMEADPGEWPGGAVSPADMTQQERGDAYWCKKNAMATGGVLRYTLDLMTKHAPAEGGTSAPDADADLDKKIREAERRAAKAVENAMEKAKGKFDSHVHGKP